MHYSIGDEDESDSSRPHAMRQLSSPNLDGIVIPKVNSPEDVLFVQDMVERHASPDSRDRIRIIASIESARAILNLKEVRPGIALFSRFKRTHHFMPNVAQIASCSPKLDALLVSAPPSMLTRYGSPSQCSSQPRTSAPILASGGRQTGESCTTLALPSCLPPRHSRCLP